MPVVFRANYFFTYFLSSIHISKKMQLLICNLLFKRSSTLQSAFYVNRNISSPTLIHFSWAEQPSCTSFNFFFFADLDKAHSGIHLEFRFILKTVFSLTSQTSIFHRVHLVRNVFYCWFSSRLWVQLWLEEEV